MGRKTWDSIPPKFRPLKSRLNIIITRSAPSTPPTPSSPSQEIRVPSLEHAIEYARSRQDIGRVFVIGGSQIYDAALRLPEAKRVLLTAIDRDFDCDTFFPLELGAKNVDWAKRSTEELGRWTGEEEDVGGEREEAGTKYEFQMWEKVD